MGARPHFGRSVAKGDGIYVDYPIAAYTSKGFAYYTIKASTANRNGAAGVSIADNNPTVYYQADLLGNTANNNMFGFYADGNTKGKGNHATGNFNLNCWHVPCS